MEDSGIDSDSKSGLLKTHKSYIPIPDHEEENDCEDTVNLNSETLKNSSEIKESEVVFCKGPLKMDTLFTRSLALKKQLEKQMLQARKFRQREQNLERMQKKLIPRSRLKVPKSEVPLVKKTDSHPLVSWESESDDDIEYHPISRSAAKEISEQLIKDGYNLDLTPDDEDLDLIPPKPLTNRCICCSLNCMCLIQ